MILSWISFVISLIAWIISIINLTRMIISRRKEYTERTLKSVGNADQNDD